jgi:5'-methylthioadenosine phosphorylase
VVLDDFVDLRGGATTFFNLPGRVTHTDFSAPFSDTLRMMVLEEAANVSTEWLDPPIVYPAGSYLCLNGPRYETPAEIRLFASWGLDVVGMTVAPEAILAHELDIEYCNISVVTNLGTGLASATLAHSEVEAQMAHSRPFVLKVLIRTLKRVLEGPA